MVLSMSNKRKPLHKNLLHLLETTGLSQMDLSRSTKIAQPQIARYFHKENPTTPSVEVLEKLAAAFGVSISDLFRTDALPTPVIKHAKISDELHAESQRIARSTAEELATELKKAISEARAAYEEYPQLQMFQDAPKGQTDLIRELRDRIRELESRLKHLTKDEPDPTAVKLQLLLDRCKEIGIYAHVPLLLEMGIALYLDKREREKQEKEG